MRRRSASSTSRVRSRIPPTATTASSTWSPCRLSSAASPPRTTRTRSRSIPLGQAHRRGALAHRLRRRPAVHRRLSRSGEALHRQRSHGRTHRRHGPARSGRRVPHRPPPAPRRRHSAAPREVPHQPCAPLRQGAAAAHSRCLVRSGKLEAMPVDDYVSLYVV